MDLDAFREEARWLSSRQGLPGQILKFTQDGGWTAKDNDMNGAEMVVLIEDRLCRAGRLWEDSRPTEYIMGFIRDRFQPPPRDVLGHTDKNRWRRYDQDPWQYTHGLPMVDNDGTLLLHDFVGGRQGLRRGPDSRVQRARREARETIRARSLPSRLNAVPTRAASTVAMYRDSGLQHHSLDGAAAESPADRPAYVASGPLFDGKVIEHNPTEHAGLKLVESEAAEPLGIRAQAVRSRRNRRRHPILNTAWAGDLNPGSFSSRANGQCLTCQHSEILRVNCVARRQRPEPSIGPRRRTST